MGLFYTMTSAIFHEISKAPPIMKELYFGMKRYFFRYLLLLMLIGGFCSCSGDGDDPIQPADFIGIWDARLNFSFDGCGLAVEGIQGIVDEQEIFALDPENTAAGVSFISRANLLNDDQGEFRSESEVFFEEQLAGDIYGIGIPCVLTARISYQVNEQGSADLIFSQKVTCDDGFSCATDAVGSARKKG